MIEGDGVNSQALNSQAIDAQTINAQVRLAAAKLAQGEVVALPTETVYGLAADASNPSALAQIFTLKQRPTSYPFIVHIAADADICHWIDDSRMTQDIWRMTRALMATYFPGPLTLVLPKHPSIDTQLTGGKDTIGLRAPNHTVFQAVLRELAQLNNTEHVGIAASSANLHGQDSPTRAEQVRATFDGVYLIDGGESVIGMASTIVDLTTGEPRIVRQGHITVDDIARVTGVTPTVIHP